MSGINWPWIALMATAPSIAGLFIAFTCWRSGQMILGNLAGTTVIFGSAIALIMREYVELDGIARRCLDAGFVCVPEPSAFIRYAIYAFVGLVEVMALFAFSLKVEEKQRRRGYDPEWR